MKTRGVLSGPGIVIVLSCCAVPATGQNLFVANMNENTIYKFTPSGSQSIFASGLQHSARLGI